MKRQPDLIRRLVGCSSRLRRGMLPALLAVSACAGLGAGAASARPALTALKACGYLTVSAGGSQIEYIKVVDTGAARAKGIFMLSGPAVSERVPLTLNSRGIALTSFPVSGAGTETMTVKLLTRPAAIRTFHFTLHPVASDSAAPTGCTPR